MSKMWYCKIGECDPAEVPEGGDAPMRDAISRAYERTTGQQPEFIFSGWGADLTEPQRACVEDRMPAWTSLDDLLYGVDGEEWPRWLGHLPWDVREVYKRIVVKAREEMAHRV